MKAAAGATGVVEWAASCTQKRYSDDVGCVAVRITKPTKEDKTKKVDVIFLLNRKSKQVEIAAIAINGEPQSLFSGMADLLGF